MDEHSFQSQSDQGKSPRTHGIFLGIVLLGAVLRLWGIGFGLPNLYARPDETEIVFRAIRFFSGDLNPHFFQYPSLFFYLIGSVFAGFFGIQALTGTRLDTFLAQAAVDPDPFFLLARGVSALFGVLTIIVVYRGATKLLNREVGLMAAFFLAVSPLHVRDSHFATTDVALTFFTLLAGFAVLRVLTDQEWRAYAWAGVTAGLVTATKYTGILFAVPLLLAHFLGTDGTGEGPEEVRDSGDRMSGQNRISRTNRVSGKDRIQEKLGHPGPWVFLLAAGAIVFVTSPYSALDWPLSWSNFRFQMVHLGGGHRVLLGPAWIYHFRYTLPMGLGLPVYLTAIFGFGLLLFRHPMRTLVLFGFPILFTLSTASSQTVFLRYMLPVFPFACLAAGYGFWWLVQRIPTQRRGQAILLLSLLAAAPGLYRTVTMDAFLSLDDSRVLAADWLEENTRGVARVHLTGSEYGHPALPPPADSLRTLLGRLERAIPEADFRKAWAFQKDQLRARLSHGWAAERQGGFYYVPESEISTADWIVVQRSPLGAYSRPSAEMEAYLEICCEEVHRIPGIPVSLELGWYDQQDAFYLPMKDFRGIVRPGPTLSIYRPLSGERASSSEPGTLQGRAAGEPPGRSESSASKAPGGGSR